MVEEQRGEEKSREEQRGAGEEQRRAERSREEQRGAGGSRGEPEGKGGVFCRSCPPVHKEAGPRRRPLNRQHAKHVFIPFLLVLMTVTPSIRKIGHRWKHMDVQQEDSSGPVC
ncbi:hypothetical protein NHX12_017388 [Muraenolepis orangiensis]|uniref:Uncharacterized protein n=1 Tax=Muraenolepis orangiensis TaxID=630683 RepID=A0A9Q0I4K2_9TELE|nr:hypothetical protein NHX12_017388 [Muraenolepis orangiensis]